MYWLDGDLASKSKKLVATVGELQGENELTDAEKSTKQSDITQLAASVEGLKKQLEWLAKKKESAPAAA